jgi:hypothetical protein
MSASKDFNKARALFMARVSAPEIPAMALKLAYVIAYKRMNTDTQVLFIGQPELCREIGVKDPRTIRRDLLPILERCGLSIEPGLGRGHASAYRIVEGEEKGDPAPPFKEEKGDPDAPFEGEKGDPGARKRGIPVHVKGGSTSPPSNEESKEDSKEDSLTAFERWWPHYPKKVANVAARKAYQQIIRKGTATEAELLAGVMRYAAERTGKEEHYTKHPAGWLNAERWNDAPAASPPRQRSHLDNIARGLDMVGGDDAEEIST